MDETVAPDSTLARLFTWRSAISDSDLHSTVKHVALALSLYMNERGGSAWPGAERLARDTSLHVRTVRRALTFLTENGWLQVVGRGGRRGGRKIANEYVAAIPTKVGTAPTFPDDKGGQPEPETVAEDPVKGGGAPPHYSKNSSRSHHRGEQVSDPNPSGASDEEVSAATTGQRLRETFDLITSQRVQACKTVPLNPAAYRETVKQQVRKDYAEQAKALAGEHPDWLPSEIAAVLEPPPQATAAPLSDADRFLRDQAAAHARTEEHRRREAAAIEQERPALEDVKALNAATKRGLARNRAGDADGSGA